MIVGDRSRSLGSQVNCSAMVAIIWRPNFHFTSDHKRSQRLPSIATITIAGTESVSAIVAIVNDRQRSQRFNGNYQCSDCSDLNDRHSDHMEITPQRSQRSYSSDHKDRSDCVSCDLMYQSVPSLTMPRGKTPENFLKWRIPHPRAQKIVRNSSPGERDHANPSGVNFFKIQQKTQNMKI